MQTHKNKGLNVFMGLCYPNRFFKNIFTNFIKLFSFQQGNVTSNNDSSLSPKKQEINSDVKEVESNTQRANSDESVLLKEETNTRKTNVNNQAEKKNSSKIESNSQTLNQNEGEINTQRPESSAFSTLEDHYEAVVAANHHALSNILDQVRSF